MTRSLQRVHQPRLPLISSLRKPRGTKQGRKANVTWPIIIPAAPYHNRCDRMITGWSARPRNRISVDRKFRCPVPIFFFPLFFFPMSTRHTVPAALAECKLLFTSITQTVRELYSWNCLANRIISIIFFQIEDKHCNINTSTVEIRNRWVLLLYQLSIRGNCQIINNDFRINSFTRIERNSHNFHANYILTLRAPMSNATRRQFYSELCFFVKISSK